MGLIGVEHIYNVYVALCYMRAGMRRLFVVADGDVSGQLQRCACVCASALLDNGIWTLCLCAWNGGVR